MPSAYGADFAGVMAYLPHRTVTATTSLTQAEVEGFLIAVEGRITSRIGGLLGSLDTVADAEAAARAVQFRTQAGDLAEMGAASWAESALFPEGSSIQSGNEAEYAPVLWARFEKGLDDLESALQNYLRARGGGPSALAGVPGPSYAFPDATITDTLVW